MAPATNAPKLLVVEDEPGLQRLLKYNLAQEGYRVCCVGSAEAALRAARRESPDLILLDVMLPKMDGLQFLRRFRRRHQTPVLLLSAKRSTRERVEGLTLGATDYVPKPFSLGELLARVEAILRRALPAGSRDRQHSVGRLWVDPERREVRVAERPVALTLKEFDLLRVLIKARGKVLSRRDLLERVWGISPDAGIETRTVDQHVARLRRKLLSEGRRIATVLGYGYRLDPD